MHRSLLFLNFTARLSPLSTLISSKHLLPWLLRFLSTQPNTYISKFLMTYPTSFLNLLHVLFTPRISSTQYLKRTLKSVLLTHSYHILLLSKSSLGSLAGTHQHPACLKLNPSSPLAPSQCFLNDTTIH